jgi:hypothetical protein
MLPKNFSREALLNATSALLDTRDLNAQLSTLGGRNLTLEVSPNGEIALDGGVLLEPSMGATNG